MQSSVCFRLRICDMERMVNQLKLSVCKQKKVKKNNVEPVKMIVLKWKLLKCELYVLVNIIKFIRHP